MMKPRLVPPVNIHSILKRSFDILVSLTALVFLSPLFILIAMAIRIESKGPNFLHFKKSRTGIQNI